MKKRMLLSGLMAVFLISCELADENLLNVPQEYSQIEDNFVPQDYAEVIASQGNGFYLPQSDEFMTKSTEIHEVESVIPLNDLFGQTALYIINLKDGGYRIIAADNRVEPILAHSNVGAMTEEGISANEGLKMWLEGIVTYISETRLKIQEQSDEVKALWSSFNSINVQAAWPKEASSNMNCSYDGQTFSEVRTYGPLINTKWHQGAEFNKFLDDENCSTTGNGKPYLGCTTLAAGIAMRCLERPTYIDWDSMPLDEVADPTASFLAQLAENIGVSFGCDGSSANINEVCDALKDDYGFSNATVTGFSPSVVNSEIANKRSPVIVRGDNDSGGAHEFVVSGVMVTNMYKCVKVPYMDSFEVVNIGAGASQFFVDWGHGGDSNAWYLQSGFLYPRNLKMIVNILR